jgi:hypothetical protein
MTIDGVQGGGFSVGFGSRFEEEAPPMYFMPIPGWIWNLEAFAFRIWVLSRVGGGGDGYNNNMAGILFLLEGFVEVLAAQHLSCLGFLSSNWIVTVLLQCPSSLKRHLGTARAEEEHW